MINLTYRSYTEEADLAGCTVSDIREQYLSSLKVDDRAVARLNGRNIRPDRETETVLHDGDRLVFTRARRSRAVYLVGVLLIALLITGGTFAYGFTSGSTTITGTAATNDFAVVTANNSSTPSWNVLGMLKASTGGGTLFDIDTADSQYSGDLVVTVSLANIDELASTYRHLSLSIEIRDSANNIMDINGDSSGDDGDTVILTLENGSVMLPLTQGAPDVYTVLLKSGFYIAQPYSSNWASGSTSPTLYCDVAQR